MSINQSIIVMLASYALGCFTSAYYLVLWRTGRDIREVGSGNAGATNAGRVLGAPGFAMAFFFDFVKGALAVSLAWILGLGQWAMLLTMVAVVAGHIWPIQLHFRGGKGVATSLGALLMFDGLTALIVAGGFVLLFLMLRNFTLSGLLAFVLCPLALLGVRPPDLAALGSLILAILVLVSHRENLRQEWCRWRSGRPELPPDKPATKEVK